MRPYARPGRPICFADLRPSNTFQAASQWTEDEARTYEVVAVVINEWQGPPQSEQPPMYEYVYLGANTEDVDDCVFLDLESALAHLDDAAGIEWEHVPAGADVGWILDRLGRPSGL